MIYAKNIPSILLFILLILTSCKIFEPKMINNTPEKSKEEINKEMLNYLEEEKKKNEKKFDSLNIKEDSLRNKSTLSGFIDDVSYFNETTEVKKK